MNREEIKTGMTVRNTITGKIGVSYQGCDYGVIGHSTEIAIVNQGDDKNPDSPSVLETPFENLEPYQLKPKDLLTKAYIEEVCRPCTSETCRYLIVGADGFECARVLGDTSIALNINDRVREGSMRAQGNNCGGRYGSSK